MKKYYETPEAELLRFAAAEHISASDDEIVDDGDATFDAVIPAP